MRASTGLDLPSEAQWEYACRADSAGAYNVTSQPIDNLGWDVGNSDGSGQHAHQEVGMRMPNAWGLYDMHGNVSEICGDWFNEACLADSTDPTGPPQGSLDEVVLRGGSYLLPAIQCRSANCAGLWYPIGINYAGFRVVVNLAQ